VPGVAGGDAAREVGPGRWVAARWQGDTLALLAFDARQAEMGLTESRGTQTPLT
jgi:hypothetical protein